MWLPDLADEAWLADVVAARAEAVGVTGSVDLVRLVDARLTHPHRPGSPLCRGWATCVVHARGGAPVRLYVKGYPDAGTAAQAWREDRSARPQGRSVLLRGLDLVVWPFPDDPRLPSAPLLVDPHRVADAAPARVRAVLGEQPLRSTVVRYQPEASITVRLEAGGAGGPAVFAKQVADGEVAAAGGRHRALWSAAGTCPELRVAEPLGVDDVLGVLWTRGIEGCPLTAAVPPHALADEAAAVGPLVAAVHGTPTDAPLLTVAALRAELAKKAAKLTRALPAVGPRLGGLLAATCSRTDEVTASRVVTLHGDLHLDQLVACETGPVLVDLDSMVRGAPEVDLAEFLVDLALRRLPDGVAGAVAHGFLTSYAAAAGTGVDRELLDLCATAEFVNRCYRHLRRYAPGWQEALTAELDRHRDVAALLRG